MKAVIPLGPEALKEVLVEFLQARGCTYIDHSIDEDGSINIDAEIPLPQPLIHQTRVVAATPTNTAPTASLSHGDLAGPSDDPDEDSDNTDAPPRRSHPKSVDDELARIMEENIRLQDEAKAKANVR